MVKIANYNNSTVIKNNNNIILIFYGALGCLTGEH